MAKLKDFGCQKTNCALVHWETFLSKDMTRTAEHQMGMSNTRGIFIVNIIPNGVPLSVENEEPAYVFSSFLADFGGYLGLLLGASLLSIYDTMMLYVDLLFSKVRKKTTSNNKL